MRISDWSSDVCSSDLTAAQPRGRAGKEDLAAAARNHDAGGLAAGDEARKTGHFPNLAEHPVGCVEDRKIDVRADVENHPLERCGCLGLGEEGGNIVGDAGVEPARRDAYARRCDLIDERVQLVAAAAADLAEETLTCKSLRDRRSAIVSRADDRDRCVSGFYCHAIPSD